MKLEGDYLFEAIDQRALDAAVTKELANSLMPRPVVFGAGLALGAIAMWFFSHH